VKRFRTGGVERTPWRNFGPKGGSRAEGGFTLIELVIVSLVLPVVLGAIAFALISIFSLQSSTSSRISQSADAQVVSSNFETDVQDASYITTNAASTSPAPCETTAQASDHLVFSVQMNLASQAFGVTSGSGQTEVSYVEVPSGVVSPTYSLVRNVCQAGNSVAPVTTQVVSNYGDVPVNQPVSITCNPTAPSNCGAASSWISTATVTGVTFATLGAGTNAYPYTVVAVPTPSATSSNSAVVASPNTSCVFATGSGTYTGSLCFVDLSAWNTYNGTSSSTCPGAGLAITAGINRTEDTLSFCLNVTSTVTSGGAAVSGSVSGGGWNGVAAVSFPTYGGAFLGNNGFYDVAPTQDPALYQQNTNVGKKSIVTITNIKVSDPDASLATGWELVTGDAESTDVSESMSWASNADLTLLPNTPTSPVGNACGSVAPAINTQYLTGLGGPLVTCTVPSTEPGNKTGTVMLEAPSPQSLTVTMIGTGLEAMFLGVLLPYSS
jgi:hypothetical protein